MRYSQNSLVEMEFVKSVRGKDKLVLKSYLYTKERSIGEKEIWKCEDRNCKARVHSNGQEVVKELGMHYHPPIPGKAKVMNVLQQMKVSDQLYVGIFQC